MPAFCLEVASIMAALSKKRIFGRLQHHWPVTMVTVFGSSNPFSIGQHYITSKSKSVHANS
jgi:hypothetical protein